MKPINLFVLLCSSILFFGCNGVQPTENGTGNTADTSIVFTDVSKSSGVLFRHTPNRSEKRWMPETMNAGVAVIDVNRDGAPDLVFSNGGRLGTEERDEKTKDRLYINDGKGKFTDQTEKWNLTSTGYGGGIAVGDFDNDGWTDLFLTSFKGDNRLLRNTGEKFEDVSAAAGIKSDGEWATSAGFADLDGDNDLDIFVIKYIVYVTSGAGQYRNGIPTYSGPYQFDGVSDQIWKNEGNGKFTDFSEQAGITGINDKGLALAIGDIDKDGDQDIYVANDTTPNQLWINSGDGTFKDMGKLSGSAYSEIGLEEGSMGVDFSDTDGNDRLDIIVTNFLEEPTALYSQISPLLFREVSDSVGIGETSRRRLAFGVDFFDADNDGDEDLIVANGHIEENIGVNSDSVTYEQQNTLYENDGKGRFTDVSDSAGSGLKEKQVSRGLVTVDLDSDGDLDFVVANNGGDAQIVFNETVSKGNFVGLLLEGNKSNRDAIGARLVAKIGEKSIERQIMGSQSYLSVSDFRVLFGLGKADKIDNLDVYWPDGEKQTLTNVTAGKYYLLRQGVKPEPLSVGSKR